ncbi:MAG: muconolactone Delta-isomerase family protein [Candidatus Nitrosocaldaceae archaeon]
MKFLVIWSFRVTSITSDVIKNIFSLREYAKSLKEKGKLEMYYHIVGKHGGAWIFNVESNEELENLIAAMPVYNLVEYEIYPLTEMH